MKLINEILHDKKQGIDCTEDESAYIKGWLRETIIKPEDGSQQVLEEIQLLFPIEYGEYLSESATPSPLPENIKGDELVSPEVLAEIREYTNLPIMLTIHPFPDNHSFAVRGKHCDFTELTKYVEVYLHPTPGNEQRSQIWPEKITAAEVEAGVKWSFAVCFEIARRYNEYKEATETEVTRLKDLLNSLQGMQPWITDRELQEKFTSVMNQINQ